ncbi:MAG TPA: hypothetical protein VKR55_03785 [Bradyrhizobium sp.]|uniref:hypothetical protein n=1 Tax=Bradyrhizobium sp. TaxID=376 RepID=UPI002C5A2FD4|nr:hypothetical protein [Bradyrhizobium sp.]HLZ01256.1 hypothetical protein [Bradyrhizobium sp.]
MMIATAFGVFGAGMTHEWISSHPFERDECDKAHTPCSWDFADDCSGACIAAQRLR